MPLPEEREKAAVAETILDAGGVCLCVQVLQEFYVQAVRATRTNRLTHQEAVGLIQKWQRFPVQETTTELLNRALETRKRWGISYWDAAIIEAARLQGCAVVLSEDLADGQDYAGVRVKNPFAGTTETDLIRSGNRTRK